jgi:hypothetical protein
MVLNVLIVKVYNMNNKSSTIRFPSYRFLIIVLGAVMVVIV